MLAALFIGTTLTLLIAFPRLMNELADVLGTQPTTAIIILHLAIAFVIDFLLFYIAFVLPWRRAHRVWDLQGLIVEKGQGRAYIDIESARQQVYSAITRVPDVQRAEVNIDNELGKATVRLSVVTTPNINGPRKKQEINREIRKVIQDQLGVRLAGEPSINFSLVQPESRIPVPAASPVMSTLPAPTPTPAPPPVVVAAPLPATPAPSRLTPPTLAEPPERSGFGSRFLGNDRQTSAPPSLSPLETKSEPLPSTEPPFPSRFSGNTEKPAETSEPTPESLPDASDEVN